MRDTSATSGALHERARAFIRAWSTGIEPPESFDHLACDIARFQAANSAPVGRLYRARRLDPSALARAAELPAVPTDAFKLTRVAAHAPADDAIVFRTSGTTQGARGEHAMRTTATYDEAALAFGRQMLAPEGGEFDVLALMPAPPEAPDSSLGHMCARFGAHFGSGTAWLLRGGEIDVGALRTAVERAAAAGRRVMLLATSFAFVHLLDRLDQGSLALPPGSRAMQTGGFKGRSREVDAADLRGAIAGALGLDPRAVVAEYGMTELSSQAYEGTLRAFLTGEGTSTPGVFETPPWCQVEAVEGATLRPAPRGQVGLARVVDLANVDSAVAVQTADLVRVVGERRFELLGRAPGAVARGCSLAIEELLGAGR